MVHKQDKKLVRSIIKQVHPDLLSLHPYERQCNSDSLKLLNAYVEELSSGKLPRPARLEFHVRQEGTSDLKRITVQLPPSGLLAPLYHAFGLISDVELKTATMFEPSDVSDVDFALWLREQVTEAVRTAEQHEMLKWHIRKARNSLEERFGFVTVQAGAEYATSLKDQERQVEALKILDGTLTALSMDEGGEETLDFSELSLQLYHPDSCPIEFQAIIQEPMRAHVADDGVLHVVAERRSIRQQIRNLDLHKARVLTRVASIWQRRVRDLTPAVTQLLGVKNVWCDIKSDQNSQKFVIWAGYLLEQRELVQTQLKNRAYQFSVIVSTDPQGPLIAFQPGSPVLNVRCDCPPNKLIDFLASEAGSNANNAAGEVHDLRAREEALLEHVRKEIGAKCLIKICMHDNAIQGAQRLLDSMVTLRAAGVDLRGACIAIDDCYEVWDSGFISIPYNFQIHEFPTMLRMLKAGSTTPSASESSAAAAAATSTSGVQQPSKVVAMACVQQRQSHGALPVLRALSGTALCRPHKGARVGLPAASRTHSLGSRQRSAVGQPSRGSPSMRLM